MRAAADRRNCEQCGTSFVPPREHARFCSTRCRSAWDRVHLGDLNGEASALQWSAAAMIDATQRLANVRARDKPLAFAAIGEAVWWVTIVDATLVRHHLEAYDALVSDQPPEQRQSIEETLAGLRFVRNHLGHDIDFVDFICRAADHPDTGDDHITAWTWKSAPEPALGLLSPGGQAWEMERYRAYQARLAGNSIGETFGLAAAFLEVAVASAPSGADSGAPAER
jgi:endogenous inhibitor of DNA gyrase (YacG/DUF329 family)